MFYSKEYTWFPYPDFKPVYNKKQFLITNDKGFLYICTWIENLSEFDDYNFPELNRGGWVYLDSDEGWIEDKNVIAWSYLPEPYKPM